MSVIEPSKNREPVTLKDLREVADRLDRCQIPNYTGIIIVYTEQLHQQILAQGYPSDKISGPLNNFSCL